MSKSSSPTRVSLDQLNAAEKATFVAAIGETFEHAPWIAEAAYALRPFATLASLNETMAAAVRSLTSDQQLALIRGHPELAGKAARAGAMTGDSVAEQSAAGLDSLSEQEFAHFHRMNETYRETFGFPFIICVRRHTKHSILHEFERRLGSAYDTEVRASLDEILRISALRLDQRVGGPDRLNVHGRLSTHVLDTSSGRPAAGIPVQLFEGSDADTFRLIVETQTNADGRTDAPLISERPLPIGHYQLVFRVGSYFQQQKIALANPPFLDIVPIRFAVATAEEHYHVPLLVTPWSYSTYRGS